MNNLSIVIPMHNNHEMTKACISTLYQYAGSDIEIVVIDNNSAAPFTHHRVRVIRNEENKGFWDALVQGMHHASNTIVMCIHNDVFLYEPYFDTHFLRQFEYDPNLAIAGLFGSRGIARNGARLYPESNMLGYKYGTHGSQHGYFLDSYHPSVVFDSYCMVFDTMKLFDIDYDVPKYHWTDRLITLRLIKAGYHAMTVGLKHDHGNSLTALCQAKPQQTDSTVVPHVSTLEELAETLCRRQGLEKTQETWDMTYYKYGESIFAQEFMTFTRGHETLWVDTDHNLHFL